MTKILAYYNENADNYLKYLADKHLKIQGLNDTIRVQKQQISTIKEELAETNAVKKYSAERGKRIKELDRDVRDRENTINNLFLRIHELEEAVRKEKEEGSKPYRVAREKMIKELDENVKDRENTISALYLRINELEEADLTRKEARPTTSQDPAGPAPALSARKMIDNAKAIKVSLLESKVRCLLLQAKNYIDNKEYPAAASVMARAEVTMCQELPHLKVLYGKVLYRNGRAMYEMGFLPEAIRDLMRALKMGFDADCSEVDGDCVRPWLDRARAAHSEAIRHGYPA